MPSKKQRRRREKGRRHEYEYVYVDEEGREVEVAEPDVEVPTTAPQKPQKAISSKTTRGSRRGRPIRKIDPPSWRRVLRRGAIFAPVMFIVIMLLSKDLSTAQVIYQTAVLMALFIPFSYLMDRMMYRTYLRKTGQPLPPAQPRRQVGKKP